MIVGTLQIELFIPDSTSLKVKRSAVKSLKDRIRSRFNVSVAEIDNNDKWQRATIGIAIVSNETSHIESIISTIMNLVDGDRRVEVLEIETRYI
jgi:uncharacterized protein